MASKPESHTTDASLAGVSHVFFDVGGTLLDSSPAPSEIFRRALAKSGHILSPEAIARTLRSPDLIVTLIRPLVAGREPEFFRSMNARLVEHLGLDPDDVTLDEIHASFESEVVWKPYPEAVRVLKALHAAGFRTGVISNYSHRLPEVLKETGLAPHLDTITYSFDVGAEKPHPRIFRAAVAQAGTVEERALHVGDSYEADYLGARRVGLHAILLRREGDPPAPCPSIRSLEELLDSLGGRGSRN